MRGDQLVYQRVDLLEVGGGVGIEHGGGVDVLAPVGQRLHVGEARCGLSTTSRRGTIDADELTAELGLRRDRLGDAAGQAHKIGVERAHNHP